MKQRYLVLGLFLGALGAGCDKGDEPHAARETGGAGGESAGGSAGAATTGAVSGGGTGGAGASDVGGHAGSGASAGEATGGAPSGGAAGSAGAHATGGGAGAGGSAPAPGGAAGASGGGVPAAAGAAGAAAGQAGSAGAPAGDTFGFALRSPAERSMTCSVNPTGSTDPALLMDEDYVCTFSYGSVEGHLYVQATPTDCQVLMGPVPTTFDVHGWLEVEAGVEPVSGLAYDHGGNHFNNTFEFDHDGQRIRFAHSSIGFGGRSCQPPDCLQVYETDGATLIEDGCTVERTLPVTCVAVESGPFVPPLDTPFAPCPGDPNYSG